MTSPDAVLVETIDVEGVAVEVWHHASMNTADTRGYRLVRPDTGEARDVTAPKQSGPAGRRAAVEAFVWGGAAV